MTTHTGSSVVPPARYTDTSAFGGTRRGGEMLDFSDLFGLAATLTVIVALSGILPFADVKSSGAASVAPRRALRPWRRSIAWIWQVPAVLVVLVLVALVSVAAENYFDPAHRLNAALADMAE
jgi:hypothetical protein